MRHNHSHIHNNPPHRIVQPPSPTNPPTPLLPRNAKSTASFIPPGYDHHITVTLTNALSTSSAFRCSAVTLEQKLLHYCTRTLQGLLPQQNNTGGTLLDIIMDHIVVERLAAAAVDDSGGGDSGGGDGYAGLVSLEDGRDGGSCISGNDGRAINKHVGGMHTDFVYERFALRRPAITSVELLLSEDARFHETRCDVQSERFEEPANKRQKRESKLGVACGSRDHIADFSNLPKEIIFHILEYNRYSVEHSVDFTALIGRFVNDHTRTFHLLYRCIKFKGDIVVTPSDFRTAEWRLLLAEVRNLRFSTLHNYLLSQYVINYASPETMPLLQYIYHKGQLRSLTENQFLADRVRFSRRTIYASDPSAGALLRKFVNVNHFIADKMEVSDVYSIAESNVRTLDVIVRTPELMRLILLNCGNLLSMIARCGTSSTGTVDASWFSTEAEGQDGASMLKLTKLEITSSRAGVSEIEQIPIVRSLRHLSVTQFKRIYSVRGISQMNRLTCLHLEVRDISETIDDIEELVQCTNLSKLTVRCGGIPSNTFFSVLCDLTRSSLQYLTLRYIGTGHDLELGDERIAQLCKWHPLRRPNALVRLWVECNALTANSVVSMLRAPNLRDVTIGRATFPWNEQLTLQIIDRGLLDSLEIVPHAQSRTISVTDPKMIIVEAPQLR